MTTTPHQYREAEEPARPEGYDGRVGSVVAAFLIVLAVAIFARSGLLAIVHLNDRFQEDWSAGTRLGLAEWASAERATCPSRSSCMLRSPV